MPSTTPPVRQSMPGADVPFANNRGGGEISFVGNEGLLRLGLDGCFVLIWFAFLV